MSTKSRQLYGSTMSPVSMVSYILITCFLMIIIGGCDNSDDRGTDPVPSGPAPEISLTKISGGEIVTNSDNEADIIVFRSLNLEGLVLTFSINIPNGYKSDSFNKSEMDYNNVMVSQDGKSAIATVYVSDVQSGVQMTYSVDDKKGKRRTFTITPQFRIDLSQEDIVAGQWSKTGFNYQDEYDITLLTTTADQSILAVSGKLIRKSSDGGHTWKEVTIPGFNLNIEAVKLHPSGDLYAISNNKIARSSDNGDTWSLLDSNLPPGSIEDIGFRPDGKFQISFYGLAFEAGFWISDDGILWSQLPATIDDSENLNSSLFYFSDLVVINDSTTLMIVYNQAWGELDLIRTADYGKTWKRVHRFFNYGITQILLATDGKLYASSYSGDGINISEDQGMTWQKIQKGIPRQGGNCWINALFEGRDGNIYAAPNNFGVFIFEKNEERWKSVGTDLAAYNVQEFTAIEGRIYAGVQYYGLYMLK